MKNGFLKFTVISAIFFSTIAQARDTSQIAPVFTPGFTASLTALYLQPSASNLEYAVYTTQLPLPAPNWEQRIVNPHYTPAFDLGLQYNFPSGRDQVKFDWLYFSSKDQASAGSLPNTSVGPAYYYGPAEQFLLNTSANSTVKFNVYDSSLVFGHVINLTDHVQFEPFIGFDLAYLRQDITNNYFGSDPVYGPYSHAVYGKSKFVGIGPRLGLDSSYFITNHFAITGQIAGDLLAGSVDYSTDFTSGTSYTGGVLPHNNVPARTSMAHQNQYRIVPELDIKLAALYKISFERSHSELVLQAGYSYAVYFNAIQQVLPNTLVPGSWEAGSVAIINQTEKQSNIDLRGPFVSASWTF
jgi:hypothetical protein